MDYDSNTILYSGIAHPLPNVLSLGAFDRASLKLSAPPSEQLAFSNATTVSSPPFSSVALATDLMAYSTTPVLHNTIAPISNPCGQCH
ncbi:hypothetical protein CC80DRAFT_561139, partial [Byssothecium circinans]